MMTLAIHDQRLAKPGPQHAALRDYDSVRRAIAFISETLREQPTIEAMADAAAVTPDELHHLFRRWAGLTPKAFMQALTLDHAKGLLRESASVLDAALDSGLSGPGRLHDLFRDPRGDVAGRMEERRRRHDTALRLPSLAIRHRDRESRPAAGSPVLPFADPGEEQIAFADMKSGLAQCDYVEDRDGTGGPRAAHLRHANVAPRTSRCAWC